MSNNPNTVPTTESTLTTIQKLKLITSNVWSKAKKPLAGVAVATAGVLLFGHQRRLNDIESALQLEYDESKDEWEYKALTDGSESNDNTDD